MVREADRTEEGLFPVRPVWFEMAFYLFLLAWLSYILYEAIGWDSFENYLFVYILSPVIAVLLVYRIVSRLFPNKLRVLDGARGEGTAEETGVESGSELDTTSEAGSGTERPKSEREKYVIYMIVWTAALPVMMFFFGMAWSLPVYIFSFVWFFTDSLKKSAIVTVISIGFIYVVFIEILNILLWEGYLGLPNPLNYLP